jgi:WD40 repeat protein
MRVTDEHRRKGKPSNYMQHRFQGTLVTTLYEHKNPVNTVSVTDDSNYFFTGSREDRKVHVWKVANIEQDITSRPIHSI